MTVERVNDVVWKHIDKLIKPFLTKESVNESIENTVKEVKEIFPEMNISEDLIEHLYLNELNHCIHLDGMRYILLRSLKRSVDNKTKIGCNKI